MAQFSKLHAEFRGKDKAGFRPVIKGAANDLRLACAPVEERSAIHLKISLEGDLQAVIKFQQLVRSKQQARFAHIDGFARTPGLPTGEAITQRHAQIMTRGAIDHGSSLAWRRGRAFLRVFHYCSVDRCVTYPEVAGSSTAKLNCGTKLAKGA